MNDSPGLLVATILGLVEGATEFLPVSSTGHLIAVGALLDYTGDRAATFQVFIQVGAILAVIWHYRARRVGMMRNLLSPGDDRRLAINVLVAFLPAAVIGFLAIGYIKSVLFSTTVVAVALIVGGLVMYWIERLEPATTAADVESVTLRQALLIGLAQCIAMIPGTSRAAATILGGYAAGLSRQTATEFSFLLAIPTILGAGTLDLWQSRHLLGRGDIPMFAVGTVVSFISALLVIRGFLRFVERHSFRGFAGYRIGFGLLLLLLIRAGMA
ncbi:MAG TPA: undecaprenyl-diphosphate phosphatase [Gemmatimonadales bacterium]|nr:undecaprenyl-diphosphate phosphatase [Gemmatimonadales bacterium]